MFITAVNKLSEKDRLACSHPKPQSGNFWYGNVNRKSAGGMVVLESMLEISLSFFRFCYFQTIRISYACKLFICFHVRSEVLMVT